MKIERRLEGQCTTIRLIGHVHAEHLMELRALTQGDLSGIILDLDEVTLVDVDVVRFLNVCEAQGGIIRHGPLYIREWMRQEHDRRE